jgi:hypothetical protein
MNGALRARSNKRARIEHIDFREIDIEVEGKAEQVVMISANQKGQKIAEDLWPDIKWSTDEKFSKLNSADRLFTHIRVTKLPPHLEDAVPLNFANVDSLAFAVAAALHQRGWPLRVVYWTGYDKDLAANTFDSARKPQGGTGTALFAEYVPAGTPIRRAPETEH